MIRLLPFMLLIVTVTPAGSDPNGQSNEVILANYVKALSSLEEKFDHCKGEGFYSKFLSARNGQAGKETRSKVTFAFSGGKARQIEEYLPVASAGGVTTPVNNRPYRSVLAFNSNYSFQVTQKNAGDSFVIETLQPGADRGRFLIQNSVGYVALCPTTTNHAKISWSLNRKGFRVDRIIEVQSSPGQSRRLRIEYSTPKPPDLKPSARPILAGWLLVSPDEGWVLHEFGSIHEAYTGVGRVTYAAAKSSPPLPVKSRYRVYQGVFNSDPEIANPSIVPVLGEDFEFTSFQFADSPVSDFTLSTFGLPEFGQTVAQASAAQSRPWWVLVVAVLSAITAFVLRRLSIRGRVAKESPAV